MRPGKLARLLVRAQLLRNIQHNSILSRPSSPWLDERMAPAYVSALSLLAALLSRIFSGKDEGGLLSSEDAQKGFASRRGGFAVISAKCLRLASILALIVLVILPTTGQSAWDNLPLAVALVSLPSSDEISLQSDELYHYIFRHTQYC